MLDASPVKKPFFFSKEKLRRVIRYLDFRDSKVRATKSASQDEDEILEASGNQLLASSYQQDVYLFDVIT